MLGTFFGSPTTINVALPAGTTAIGADIMTILDYAGNVTLTLATGETFTHPSLNYPGRGFLGVTSTSPIVSLRYSTPAGGQLLDNVRFGQAIVPEPLSIAVFGGVLAAGGLAVRRRMKATA